MAKIEISVVRGYLKALSEYNSASTKGIGGWGSPRHSYSREMREHTLRLHRAREKLDNAILFAEREEDASLERNQELD